MHGGSHVDLRDGVVLEHSGGETAEEVEGTVAEENAVDDSVEVGEHFLDLGGESQGLHEVDLVDVDPFVSSIFIRYFCQTLNQGW